MELLKKILLSSLLALGTLASAPLEAAPALRKVFTLKQPNGTSIQAMQVGDEYMSFVTDAKTGECLVQDEVSGFWRPMTDPEIDVVSRQWADTRRKAKAIRNFLGGTPHKNQVKIPVLLVQYSDLKMSEQYGTVAFYDTLLNVLDKERLAFIGSDKKPYYTSSARKYFQTQSLGKFDPVFDILKPITLKNGYAYYGKDSGTSKDVNRNELIDEAIAMAIERGDLKNASQYDSDKDGRVDLLYIIYAGFGQNQHANSNTIWPHNSTHSVTTPDGTKIYDYCMTNELIGSDPNEIMTDGIGVFVHEMSHALGLPDFYGTNANTASQCYGMDAWSLMDQGEFNGMNQIPANYTLHERMLLGWCDEPETVPTNSKVILEPITKNGKGLILRNPENENEYITLEVHHKSADIWDATWGTGSSYRRTVNNGLLITHVDYDASIWNSNNVNNNPRHLRCSPMAADGELVLWPGNNTSAEEQKAWMYSYLSDIYPGYNQITKLDSTNPLAEWFTGSKMDINITDVKILSNGSVEITFGNPEANGIESLCKDTEQEHPAKIQLRNGKLVVNGFDLSGRKLDK